MDQLIMEIVKKTKGLKVSKKGIHTHGRKKVNGQTAVKETFAKGGGKGSLNFLDLFAGCGGFSEGFYNEGFESLLHVDYDQASCTTLRARMAYYGYDDRSIRDSVICGDLTLRRTHADISKLALGRSIDVLVGGPPCQTFSSVGRAQDPNSMRDDPRNYLFKAYLSILEKLRPKVFVFENVSGLLTASPDGYPIFPEIILAMRKYYNVTDDRERVLLNAVHYGVPQIRKRVILIGVRKDLDFMPEEVYDAIEKTHYCPEMQARGSTQGLKKYRTVRDAIADLPVLQPGLGIEDVEFKPKHPNEYLRVLRNSDFDRLYNHVARKHNSDDQERYRLLSMNNWQLRDLARVRPDLIHHDPEHFGNRYTVQEFDKPGRTVVAHLYKDGNLFIHPDHNQKRTFTVREAARIQSFPDDFRFYVSRTEQFKQVGNAVPPLMARQIAKAIKKHLS
jgi:DNA (cytosine-5)-methyltransferase 1